LVVKRFVVVAFVAVRLVKSPVTAERSVEKNDVVVAFVATRSVALVVARVVVPPTLSVPVSTMLFAVDVPTERLLTYAFVVVEFVSVAFVAVRFVKSPVTAERSVEKNDVVVPFAPVKSANVVVASEEVPFTVSPPLSVRFPEADVDEPTVSESV
jgi:hypothetical protein